MNNLQEEIKIRFNDFAENLISQVAVSPNKSALEALVDQPMLDDLYAFIDRWLDGTAEKDLGY